MWLVLIAIGLILISLLWQGLRLHKTGFFAEQQSKIEGYVDFPKQEGDILKKEYIKSLNRAESLSVELNKELGKIRELQHRMEGRPAEGIADTVESVQHVTSENISTVKVEKRDKQADSGVDNGENSVGGTYIVKPVALRACYSRNGSRMYTSNASLAEEWVVEMLISGQRPANSKADLYLILIQPDGSAARPASTGGIFKPGKTWLPYTKKISTDCQSGKCEFKVDGLEMRSGPYIMQVFQDNKMIGKLVNVLN